MLGKIINIATIIDVEDPLVLNRIRCQFDDENTEAILKAIPPTKNGKSTKTATGQLKPEFFWTEIDYFCVLPLIPVFINLSLKVNESVNIIRPNAELRFDEQYYVPGVFSSPLTLFTESHTTQRMFAAPNRLKSSQLLKNPLTNEYNDAETEGVFPEPIDLGLLGRGTCDIIIKERDLLLRAGKSKTIPDNANKKIVGNKNRSFIQLSDFTETQELELPRINERYVPNTSYVKTLAEWDIKNPDNNFNNFRYNLSLYNLPENGKYTTDKFFIDSNVDDVDKILYYTATFENASKTDMINNINKMLSQINEGEINLLNNPITKLNNQFPFYFRPSPNTYNYINDAAKSDTKAYENITSVKNSVSFKDLNEGFGLVSSKDKTGQSTTKVTDSEAQKSVDPNKPATYNIQGADKIVFFTHSSQIPSKKQIQLDNGGLYGISQNEITEKIMGNTEPLVRGEQLYNFLNQMYQYLINHTHSFPGNESIKGTTGPNKDTLQQMMNQFQQTILNQNIRIN